MVVERLIKLARYNRWAWDHVFHAIRQIPTEAYKRERPFFWGSLHGLFAHSLAAEIIWIDRLSGSDPTTLLGADDFSSAEEIITAWQPIRQRWDLYLAELTDEQALATLSFNDTAGFERQVMIADIVQHVFNHATDHRSQMTPFLYQLGFGTPSLDYVYFCEGREI